MTDATLPQLPQATAWITVIETSQGPSSQVNWTQMRGVKHHPLFSADQLSAFAERVRQDERELCAAVCEQRATAHFDWHDRHGYSPDLEWRVQEAKACAAAILAQQVPERAE